MERIIMEMDRITGKIGYVGTVENPIEIEVVETEIEGGFRLEGTTVEGQKVVAELSAEAYFDGKFFVAGKMLKASVPAKKGKGKVIKAITTTVASMVMAFMVGCSNVETVENKMVEVIPVNENTYAQLYEDRTVYKTFETELECAEAYTDDWYMIHTEEKEIVNVEDVNETELKLVYDNGEVINLKYETELECAETYTDIIYFINE